MEEPIDKRICETIKKHRKCQCILDTGYCALVKELVEIAENG